MKNQIATTKEQSQRLIACGINPDSADMFYTNYNIKPNDKMPIVKTAPLGIRKDLIPAWSLLALLDSVLPKHLDDFLLKWRPLKNPNVLNGDVKLYFSNPKWIVDYDGDGFSGKLPQSENPIEAVVLAIELLHANGYEYKPKP